MNKPDWHYKFITRMTDITFATFILVVMSWLLFLIFVWIKFDTPGPAIFRQKRIGKNGNVFLCFKFRTMAIGTDEAATHLVSKNNVTRSGKFLRATKLDELPQAWNIILNEMAMVGPRPCLENQEDLISERGKRNILTIKPGITGLSQIRNIDMSDPVRLANSDAEYLKMRSLALDIKILFWTICGKGQGDK